MPLYAPAKADVVIETRRTTSVVMYGKNSKFSPSVGIIAEEARTEVTEGKPVVNIVADVGI